jgi:hypothetical protein
MTWLQTFLPKPFLDTNLWLLRETKINVPQLECSRPSLSKSVEMAKKIHK